MSDLDKRHLVIGTAGHIDHGKTALVRALTGMETDSLEEEKRRGITIDLGFAFLEDQVAFVDVPGHERFIKNMVAGASAIQAALLVVAADDGIMPQTREHLVVLDALGISEGIIAITKADLADDDWVELVVEEVRDLLAPTGLKDAEIIVVDSLSGKGIDELRSALSRLQARITFPADPGFFRMPVDRSFLIKGYGRVITGTVWSGHVERGSKLSILPSNDSLKVRGLQAHEAEVERVSAGDRAAINLSGDSNPERGDLLIDSARGLSSDFIDVRIQLLPDAREVKHRTRVRVHLGTGEAIGRVLTVGGEAIYPGNTGYARIALESAVPVMYGDRAVIRLYSPLETLGGAKIIDPSPPDRKRSIRGLAERLVKLAEEGQSALQAIVDSRIWIEKKEILRIFPLDQTVLENDLKYLAEKGLLIESKGKETWYISKLNWNEWKVRNGVILANYHSNRPDEAGMTKAQWAQEVINNEVPEQLLMRLLSHLADLSELKYENGLISDSSHQVTLKAGDKKLADSILKLLLESGLNSPLQTNIAEDLNENVDRVRKVLRSLKLIDEVVILDERVVIHKSAFEDAVQLLQDKMGGAEFAIGEAAEGLGSTRKYIVPLLEYLDKEGITERIQDKRRLVD